MNHIELDIVLPEALHELLIAELTDLDFEGFDQYDDHLLAWIPENRFNDVAREEIEQALARFGSGAYIRAERVQEPRNWNEEWEQSIKPINVGRFLIRPTWSIQEPEPGQILLEIDPKMSFGTGYHETTRIILRLLPEIVTHGMHVMDAGTGTGILAIAALKLGANQAFAFDNDPWCFDNATENGHINQVQEQLEVALGSSEVIPQHRFDVVIANINRHILLEMSEVLTSKVIKGGYLILSGLLREDEPIILSDPHFAKLAHLKTESENEWIGLVFRLDG